jgi:hypothetical protein
MEIYLHSPSLLGVVLSLKKAQGQLYLFTFYAASIFNVSE